MSSRLIKRFRKKSLYCYTEDEWLKWVINQRVTLNINFLNKNKHGEESGVMVNLDMDRIHQSLLILDSLSESINSRNKSIIDFEFQTAERIKIPSVQNIFTALFKMTLIETKGFLDEYHKYFGVITENVYQQRILLLKQNLKPLVSILTKWDWPRSRNELTAHSIRNSKKEFIFASNEFQLWNVPRNFNDLLLIGNIIGLVQQGIIHEFGQERIDAFRVFNGKSRVDISTINYTTKGDVHVITMKAIEQTNELLAENKKLYRITIDFPINLENV